MEGLTSLVTSVGERLKELFGSKTFAKFAKGIMTVMAGVLFGPLILQTILGGIITSVAGTAFKMLKGVLTKKGGVPGGGGVSKLLGSAGPVGAMVAAAVSIGRGVNIYTDKITSSMDKSTKRIAAGATGIIDGLTLGLLPEGWLVSIANTLATATDVLFGLIGSVFGAQFSQSIKDYIGDQLAVAGSIWGVVASAFGDDQAAFDKAVEELGLNLLNMFGSAGELMFIQLPALLFKIGVKVQTFLQKLLIKVITSALQVQITMMEKFKLPLGGLKEKLASASTEIQGAMTKNATALTEHVGSHQDALTRKLSKSRKKFLGLDGDDAKPKKDASKAAAVAGAGDSQQQSLSSTLRDIKAAKEIKKELGGKNGTNFKDMIASAKESLKDVDFNILSADQAKSLSGTASSLTEVSQTLETIQGVFDKIGDIPKSIKAAQAIIKDNAFKPAIEAVQEMVRLANDMDTALADGNLNKIDVRARLQRLAGNVGLGAKAKYTIQNKSVNITVNLQVSMNAEDLEKALLMRTKSVITQRINFLANKPEKKGGPDIPTTPGGQINPIQTID